LHEIDVDESGKRGKERGEWDKGDDEGSLWKPKGGITHCKKIY